MYTNVEYNLSARDVGSISNLGARRFKGSFSLRKLGHFLRIKKDTSLFTAKSWGHVPPVTPVPRLCFLLSND